MNTLEINEKGSLSKEIENLNKEIEDIRKTKWKFQNYNNKKTPWMSSPTEQRGQMKE